MTTEKIHEMFRLYAQQQGMQTVRAILPEEIDTYVNTQIVNKVRSVVLENTTTPINSKVTQQKNPISPLNAIRTLYENKLIDVVVGKGLRLEPYSSEIVFDESVMYYTGVTAYYNNNKSYSCRLIEGEELENTMNDYCNASSWDAPIAEFEQRDGKYNINIYTDETNRMPTKVGIRFIRKPAVIKLSADGLSNINPDVPEHIIPDIILSAVNEFHKSVNATSHN